MGLGRDQYFDTYKAQEVGIVSSINVAWITISIES
jgi:hypothetical protein